PTQENSGRALRKSTELRSREIMRGKYLCHLMESRRGPKTTCKRSVLCLPRSTHGGTVPKGPKGLKLSIVNAGPLDCVTHSALLIKTTRHLDGSSLPLQTYPRVGSATQSPHARGHYACRNERLDSSACI